MEQYIICKKITQFKRNRLKTFPLSFNFEVIIYIVELRALSTVLAISFFPLEFFLVLLYKWNNLYSKIMQQKNIGRFFCGKWTQGAVKSKMFCELL